MGWGGGARLTLPKPATLPPGHVFVQCTEFEDVIHWYTGFVAVDVTPSQLREENILQIRAAEHHAYRLPSMSGTDEQERLDRRFEG